MTGVSLLSPELAGVINREFSSLDQQLELAADWMEILELGYGDMNFEIRGGKTRFVRLQKSRDLTHRAKKDSMRAVKS